MDDRDSDDALSLAIAQAAPEVSTLAARAGLREARRTLLRLDSPPSTIGRFVVLSVLGSGAMGTVYEAYDPRLERNVALKVLRGEQALDQRMLQEARALARLSHPNVVALYEADADAQRLFIAMELVRGSNLRAWLAERHPLREVARVLAAAGRGLQAAHAAGLTHGDFKPENVLLGEGGRVCVADFGLARASDAGDSSHTLDGPGSGRRTRSGVGAGTPAYMAPEVAQGAAPSPKSDQFSFCVTLHEAVTGVGPFDPRRPTAATDTDVVGLPRPVERLLRQGLAMQQDARLPSLEPLLRALERLAERPHRGLLGLSVAATGLGIALGAIALADDPVPRCTGGGAELVGIWDHGRQQGLGEAIAGVDGVDVELTWRRTSAELDAYATAWTNMHRDACEASTVRGEQSPQTMDRRMRCLARARVGLRSVVEVFERADAMTLQNAHRVLDELPSVAACADVEALAHDVQPPPPRVAAAVEAMRARLAEVRSQRAAGHIPLALETLRRAESLAETVDYEPVRAELLIAKGVLSSQMDDARAAELALRQAMQSAAASRQWPELRDALSIHGFVLADDLNRPAEALRDLELALSLARGDAKAEAEVLHDLAEVHVLLGNLEEADRSHRRALELFEQALGPRSLEAALQRSRLAAVLGDRGEFAEALLHARTAVDQLVQLLGPNHVEVAFGRERLGALLYALNELEASEAEHRRAIAIRERAVGPGHSMVALARANLGMVLRDRGELEGAEAELRRALEISTAARGSDHPDTLVIAATLAAVLADRGKWTDAEPLLREASAAAERSPIPPASASFIHHQFAVVLAQLGRPREAEPLLRRALEISEGTFGPEAADTQRDRVNLGGVLYELGRDVEARDVLEAALVHVRPGDVMEPGAAKLLAQVLWSLDRQRYRQRVDELTARALRAYAAAPAIFAEDREEFERWLADRD